VKLESKSSGAVLLRARCGPGPRKKLVEAIVGPEIDQTGEAVGKPSLGIDIILLFSLAKAILHHHANANTPPVFQGSYGPEPSSASFS
jgi:hypothetical protein